VASNLAVAVDRSALLRAMLRRRWVLLALAAVGAALLEVHTTGPSTDGWYFAGAGRDLLSAHGLHVYATDGLQAGPLQIGAFGLLAHLTALLHLPADPTYAVISTLGSTALVGFGTRRLRRDAGLADSPVAELLTGSLAIGWLIATEVYTSGHPAELVVPGLWIAAAILATKDRSIWAGVLVGLGAGFETWAVLGLPVLLLCGDWRKTARAVAACGVVAGGMYLPFVLAGPFRMGQLVWSVAPTSLVHSLDPRLTGLPWSGRLAQALVVVGLGALAWGGVRRPSSPAVSVWLIPAVIALAKAITEPAAYEWYWLPAQIALLGGVACVDGLSRRLVAVLVLTEGIAVTTPLHAWPITLPALVILVFAGWGPAATRRLNRLRTLRSTA
jgi:hypothetical protein